MDAHRLAGVSAAANPRSGVGPIPSTFPDDGCPSATHHLHATSPSHEAHEDEASLIAESDGGVRPVTERFVP